MQQINAPSPFWTRLATHKKSLPLLLGALVVLLAVFYMLELKLIAYSGVGLIDRKYGYCPAELADMLEKYGPEGRQLHLIIYWTADLLFPAVYFLLFTVALIRTGAVRFHRLPILLVVMDFLENSSVGYLLWKYPEFNRSLAGAAGVFTLTKHILSFSILGIILFYWLKTFRKRA